MSGNHDVISAFLDDQSFDLDELADTLNDPAGRAILIDLIALGRIVQPIDAMPAITAASRPWRRPWHYAAAAAVLLVALGGGYLAGERRAVATSSEAPPPTRVVEAVPFTPPGGLR